MKFCKRFVLLPSVFVMAVSLNAVEFNGILSDDSYIKFNGNKYDTQIMEFSESFTGSVKAPLNADGSTYFSAEAIVTDNYDVTTGENNVDGENEVVLDCNLFKFSSLIKMNNTDSLQISLGRFFVSDVTGLVFAQNCDGAFFQYDTPRFAASLYGGYTGLLNVKNISHVSFRTGSVWEPGADDEKDLYDFTAPYIVGGLSLSAPYCFLNQTVTLEGYAFIGSSGPADIDDNSKDESTRIYGTLSVNGPLSTIVFYNLSGTVLSAKLNKDGVDMKTTGILAQGSLNFYPNYKSSSITLSGVYASGKDEKYYMGFTKATACSSASEPILAGIIKGGIAGSILPIDKMFCSLGCDAVFRIGDENDPDGDTKFYGYQLNAVMNYQLFSDMKLGLSGASFIGKEKDDCSTKITVSLALSF